MGKFYLSALLVMITLLLVASACTSSPPASSPTVAVPTVGQLAEAGKTIFANRCAKCHGDQGQGITAPTIIGTNASLGKYNTAQGLLNFINTTMPLDAPGSLSQQEYRQLLCFLLVQNKFVPAEAVFDPNQIQSLPLNR